MLPFIFRLLFSDSHVLSSLPAFDRSHTVLLCIYNVRGCARGKCVVVSSPRGGGEEATARGDEAAHCFLRTALFSENENKVMVATAQPTFHLARSSFFSLSLQVLLSRNWDANERLQDSPPSPSDSSSSNSPYPYPSSTTPNPRSRQFPISFPKRKKGGGELAFLISLATFCSPTFPLPFSSVCCWLFHSIDPPSPLRHHPWGELRERGTLCVRSWKYSVHTPLRERLCLGEKVFFSPPLSVA